MAKNKVSKCKLDFENMESNHFTILSSFVVSQGIIKLHALSRGTLNILAAPLTFSGHPYILGGFLYFVLRRRF